MDDSTLSERLMQLGLSEKEVDTYLTVLEQGELTASEISDVTGVSKRYVYSISESLEERGFVDVDDHVVPTKVRARNPSEVIELLTDELTEMEPALSERHSQTERNLQRFDVLKSRQTMIKRIRSYIADASNEITLSISYEQLPEVEDELRAAVDRGVLAMVLVTGVPANSLEAAAFDGIATLVRTWDQITPLTLTVDQQYSVLAPVDMMVRSNSELRAISLVQRQLVPILTGSFFGNYWPIAAEVYVDDPRSLPAEYGCFRHAVLDATLHLRDDRPISIDTAVTPCRDTEDRQSIEGTVIGTHQGLVEPATNDFPVENSLVVKTNNRRVTVGGPGAMLEDFEAKDTVTLTAD
ncbi:MULTISPECIES: TrmB family transcriptional regulator [Halomicrobium]|uniref:Transcriptional regulator, TrmB n=2 Tax=Halomicrobium mukohataei TaxID=57705 RepID=C7NWY0_HALMD|nr:transcriptional regulator, TrmB [Halomicrobium mukohataei DSM 12286]QCD64901.1 TrmB family transcriptional regulator [Halomicrobium mukohataei]QFR19707.1 TrmB family transcriptional regulator [Halomicrobium sp. ZPS1]